MPRPKRNAAAKAERKLRETLELNDNDSDDESPSPTKHSRIKSILDPTPINYELRFEDLGGLSDQIEVIKETVIFRQENAALLKRSGLKHVIGGILLEGPPGTGKTVCAHTIAAELSRRSKTKYTFYTHDAVESFSKWMGEGEKTLQRLFQTAAQNKPAIIFFDEFDSICSRRDSSDYAGQSYRTMVGTLLAEFNKIQDNETIIIATTNLQENIDPAMLRKGRFDITLHFPLPNETQRKEILRVKMMLYNVDSSVFDHLAKVTEGLSGASLTFLCDEAKLNAFKRQKDELGGTQLKYISRQDFEQVFQSGQLPRSLINCQTQDALFDEAFTWLESSITPRLFTYCDIINNNHIRSSSCLIRGEENCGILHETILPKILQDLNQRVFKINTKILNLNKGHRSLENIFNAIVDQAKCYSAPSILLIECIDTLPIDPNDMVQTLDNLGFYYVFLLCTTSSQPVSYLTPEIHSLFDFPRGLVLQLPDPSDSIICKSFKELFKNEIQPILSPPDLRSRANSNSMKLCMKRIIDEVLQLEGSKSLQRLITLQSNIRFACKTSAPDTLMTDVLASII